MLGAIKYGLSKLLDPSGRDGRQTFWYFVLFVVVLRFVAGMVISIPLTTRTITSAVEAAKAGADPAAAQAQTMAAVTAMMPQLAYYGMAVGAVSMLLLAAALVRRLHDSDMSGWWVLLPGAIYAYALARTPEQVAKAMEIMQHMDGKTPPNPMTMMQGQGAMMILPWIPVLIAIWFGVRASTPGPNRFGDAPVNF
ncbi:MAG: DUF805 domain-containing protein [Sphingomonadales bacterium]|nr:DUF805 domain-containing protein [Sphingomonadales bacterium]